MTKQIKLGVVGPKDSIQKIIQICREFPNFKVYSFVYQDLKEAERIVINNKERIDQWFFSGQSPYDFVIKKKLLSKDDATFPKLNGTSLLGTLLHAMIKEGRVLKTISLDMIPENEVRLLEREHQLSQLQIYTYSRTGYFPIETILHFHRELYTEGKIEMAFTFLSNVYDHLRKEGIPCFRVTPSEFSIRNRLLLLNERFHLNWYRRTQMAIVGIEVFDVSHSYEEKKPYEWKKSELDLNYFLLDYAKEINASFVRMGDGLYYFYTTWGELENSDLVREKFFEDVNASIKQTTRMGIGFGINAIEAEENVRTALSYARQSKEPIIIQVNEDKEVIEYKAKEVMMNFKQRYLGKAWEQTFKDANMNPSMAYKILTLSQRYHKEFVTALEVSQWLKCTERNARRILTELESLNLAKVYGEEQSGNRGRPRKVYQLKLTSFSS